MKRHQRAILSALEHIRKAQQPDGSFISLSSTDEHDFSAAVPRTTTFFASNILLCLEEATAHIKTFLPPEALAVLDAVKKSTAQFLLEQKSAQWSFNYWDRHSREFATIPYPDDLDDTFAALASLAQYDRAMIGGGALAEITKVLVGAEASEGGPYKTWLAGNDAPPHWQDIDVAVNSTVGYFLSLIGMRLPRLDDFIKHALENGAIASPYYPGTLHVAYFISRYHKARINCGRGGEWEIEKSAASALASIITARLNDTSKKINSLERAMAISSLINLGHGEKIAPADEAKLLSDMEHDDFAPHAFCIDPARDGKRCYAGASALTAAFAIEALSLAADNEKNMAIPDLQFSDEAAVQKDTAFHARIRDAARASCAGAGTELYAIALSRIEKASDKKITCLAYEFQSALQAKGKTIPSSLVQKISLANLYGWMAYEIYDDMLDGEGDPLLIPCANLFLRKLAGIYSRLDRDIPGARDLFDSTMDRLDNANGWELGHCRLSGNTKSAFSLPSFDGYENLADRSIGHAVGPLTLLHYIGCGADSKEYQYVLWLFRHYLIARQLHDDAHDWADDLLRGRVNSIGTLVLKRFQNDNRDTPSNVDDDFNIPAILPAMQKIFWEEILDEATDLILSHITAARAAAKRSTLLNGTNFLEKELTRLESSARKARSERDAVVLFIECYQKQEAL